MSRQPHNRGITQGDRAWATGFNIGADERVSPSGTVLFGKHLGKNLKRIDANYLRWMLRQTWLSPKAKEQITELLK